jgi:hypothetical protein
MSATKSGFIKKEMRECRDGFHGLAFLDCDHSLAILVDADEYSKGP